MANKHNPIKCFDGNAQPYEPFWRFVDAAQSESGQAEMELYGFISQYSWFEDEISPKKFKQDLYKFGKGGPVLVKIDSPGGDVIAASTMRTIMADYPGEITTRVDGMAASAAVIIAIAGKTVKIMDSAYMMIHDPAVVAFLAVLDIETLGRLRDALQSIKDGIIPAYAAKTGLTEGVISNMMTNETWMSAREAKDYGFADEILTGGQNNQKQGFTNVAYINVLQSYENVPPALLNLSSQEQPAPVDVERERNIQRLRERVSKHIRKENPND
jgi:ATP-dependent Clp protease protease subunit